MVPKQQQALVNHRDDMHAAVMAMSWDMYAIVLQVTAVNLQLA